MYEKVSLESFLEMVDAECESFDNADEECLEDKFTKELSKESSHIKEFFCCDKCKSIIKEIYEKIRNNEIPYNKVNTIDVNKVIATYKEYNDGMITFIKKIMLSNNELDDVVEDKIHKSIERDKDFIEQLFDDTKSEYSINEAMMNIEYLVDLTKDIEVFVNNMNEFKLIKSDCEVKYLCEKLYAKSTSKFIHKLLKSIFKTFDAIKNSISTREPAVKKPDIDNERLDIF